MPPKAAAAPVPESVLKKQAATKKSAEDRAKQQAVRKQVRPAAQSPLLCCAVRFAVVAWLQCATMNGFLPC